MKIRNKFNLYTLLLFLIICLASTEMIAKEESIHVTIRGVSPEMEENIRTGLSLLQESSETLSTQRISQYEEQAKEEITLALQPFGYYSPEIQSHIYRENNQWVAIFQILLGTPIRLTAIHFHLAGEGENDPYLQTIFLRFPLKIGEVFVHELYDQGKKAILSSAIQAGYLNAIFSEHRVNVDPDMHSGEIFLTLQTGSKHYFGATTFSTSKLSDQFLNRYLPYEQGDRYAPEKILALQSALTQSDYFASVNVKALPDEASDNIPVLVELEDAKPNQYILGGGYGTDTGLRGKLGWTRRTLNAYGHRFNAQAQISEIYHKLQAEYAIPGKHPQTDQLKLKAGYYEDEFSEKTSQIIEAGILEERKFPHWQRRLSLNYHHEDFLAFGTNQPVHSKLILPGVNFTQTQTTKDNDKKTGRRIELNLRGSVDALFSDTSFFQAYLQLKWLHAFDSKTKILARTELGFTLPDESDQLPLSQRFYAGGDLSIRGYAYRSLPSEIDQNGIPHPVGGSYLGVGSIEISRVIKKPVGVFTFFDAGNAFREFGNEVAMGTGIGVEWQTRLGPLKFAIAKPLTKDSDAWRIHATFGPEL